MGKVVEKIVRGRKTTDGAGVRLSRIIGSPELRDIDPFMLLDEIRSTDPADYVAGFPTHPHRGIETITYMVRGSFRHKDSRGGGGLLTDGSVQWMTAGGGILHSEMPEDTPGREHGVWGYQLWISLPAALKMIPPGYQHIAPGLIPVATGGGVAVKVISGSYAGASGPAESHVPTDYFDASIDDSAVFSYSGAKTTRLAYVHTGAVEAADGTRIERGELAVLAPSVPIELKAAGGPAGLLFMASNPNNEPIARGGPFVMNTEDELKRAFDDYAAGRIG